MPPCVAVQGQESQFDSALLFNWNNVFWGANLRLVQLRVREAATPSSCHHAIRVPNVFEQKHACEMVRHLWHFRKTFRTFRKTARQENVQEGTSARPAGRRGVPPADARLFEVLAVWHGRRACLLHAAGPLLEQQRRQPRHHRQCRLHGRTLQRARAVHSQQQNEPASEHRVLCLTRVGLEAFLCCIPRCTSDVLEVVEWCALHRAADSAADSSLQEERQIKVEAVRMLGRGAGTLCAGGRGVTHSWWALARSTHGTRWPWQPAAPACPSPARHRCDKQLVSAWMFDAVNYARLFKGRLRPAMESNDHC